MKMKELNLLPPERKKVLTQRATASAIIGFLNTVVRALLLLLMVGGASILLLRLLAMSGSEADTTRLRNQIEEYKQLRQEISQQNVVIKSMHDISFNQIVWADVLQTIYSRIPTGITIGSMGANQFGSPTMVMRGNAVNRNMLIILGDRLRTIDMVGSVDAPHENLIQRTDPEYTFTIQFNSSTKETDGTSEE